jgi:type II secretory pathway component PulF
MNSKFKNPSYLTYLFATYLGVVALTLVNTVGKFQTLFNENGITPTGMTRFVLSLSEAIRDYSLISFLLCLLLVMGFNWTELNHIEPLTKSRQKGLWIWGLGLTCGVLVLEGIILAAVYKPILL